jgi:predicted methyltransferase
MIAYTVAVIGAAVFLAAGCAAADGAGRQHSGVDEAALERVRAALIAPDRIEWDKPFDASRKPVQYVRFFRIRTGMKVLDLGAAAGYTTEIIAAAVGPSGRVYAQIDDPVIRLQKGFFDRTLNQRIGPDGARRSNIIYWHRDLEDAGLTNLDLVHWGFNLHDYYNQNGGEEHVQRILASALGALKPNGILAVSDHIGVAGKDNRKLHRVEIAHIVQQIEQAGFRIEARSDLLANPEDDHSLNVFADAIYRQTDRVLIRAVR